VRLVASTPAQRDAYLSVSRPLRHACIRSEPPSTCTGIAPSSRNRRAEALLHGMTGWLCGLASGHRGWTPRSSDSVGAASSRFRSWALPGSSAPYRPGPATGCLKLAQQRELDADSPDPSYQPLPEQRTWSTWAHPCAWASTPCRLSPAAWPPASMARKWSTSGHRHRYDSIKRLPPLFLDSGYRSAQAPGWPLGRTDRTRRHPSSRPAIPSDSSPRAPAPPPLFRGLDSKPQAPPARQRLRVRRFSCEATPARGNAAKILSATRTNQPLSESRSQAEADCHGRPSDG